MRIRKYRVGDAVSTAVQATAASFSLTKGANAISLLPPDTKFAVVADVIEKDFNESFAEADYNLVTLRAQVSNEGAVGRFLGYIAVTDTKLRFYKALDEDVTQRPDQQANVVGQQQSLTLVYEMDIPKVTAKFQAGTNTYFLTDGTKKFLIVQVWPIHDNEGKFESKAIGTRNGLDQLFEFINSRGGNIKISNVNNIVTLVIILAIIALFVFFTLIK